MQAAVGVAQLEKLPGFIDARRRNYAALRDGIADLDHVFVLPEATPGSEPSWFGFPLSVRADAPVDRKAVTRDAREAQDRHADALRRQPHAAARVLGGRATHARSVDEHRLRHGEHVLDRGVPGSDDGDDRLRHRRAARGGLLDARARDRRVRARRLVRRSPAAARRPRGHRRCPGVVRPVAPGRRRRPGRAAAVQPRNDRGTAGHDLEHAARGHHPRCVVGRAGTRTRRPPTCRAERRRHPRARTAGRRDRRAGLRRPRFPGGVRPVRRAAARGSDSPPGVAVRPVQAARGRAHARAVHVPTACAGRGCG